jgi:hypothetical protein
MVAVYDVPPPARIAIDLLYGYASTIDHDQPIDKIGAPIGGAPFRFSCPDAPGPFAPEPGHSRRLVSAWQTSTKILIATVAWY